MDLTEGATKIINTCANLKENENVLIVADHNSPLPVLEALYKAARKCNAKVHALVMPAAELPGEEPGLIAAAAIEAADLIISINSRTIGHSDCLRKALNKGARALVLTGCSNRTLEEGGVEADFYDLQDVVAYVKEAFNNGSEVLVKSHGGTDITLSLKGQKASACTGLCHKSGEMTGFPDVEVYIAPVEKTTNGRLVADASCSSIGLLKTPITLDIVSGKVKNISGGSEAEKLNDILASTNCESAYEIGEFAIGLNPSAKVTGNIIEDEGTYGTGHFCLGNNTKFGGTNSAPIHIDLVYWAPTITIDGTLFMEGGVLSHKFDCYQGMNNLD